MSVDHLKKIEKLPLKVVKDEEGEVKLERDPIKVLELMSNAHAKRLSIPRTSAFSREDVVNAFHDSFELIGGVPRLAIWAHSNPNEFFKLYAKMLPSSAQKQVTHDGIIRIESALQPGPLDRPAIEGEITDVD
jgi:hypothetical protein